MDNYLKDLGIKTNMQQIKDIEKRFLIIEENISGIVEKKYIFEKFNEYVKGNKLLDQNEFIGLVLRNYLDVMVIDVYKWAIDSDSRTINLVALLEDIRKNKNLFSLKWFMLGRKKCFVRKNVFREFSIKDNNRIGCQKIDGDIKKIKQAIKGKIFGKKRFSRNSLVRLRNKRKAHYDKGVFVSKATVDDLRNAVDVLEKMVIKYGGLLNRGEYQDGLSASNIDDYTNFEKIFKKS
ncbi:MAG TPA: hypothetical protein DCS28_00020 [Candidatus Moranbacteria bacterium]|nr:hypothetical protein [Candidatus Moranbacteria bacterium]HAT74423.1 hypothetical protein [Candidatus Moranbacteria bacterium]